MMKRRLCILLLALLLLLPPLPVRAEERMTMRLDRLFTTADLMDATVEELQLAMQRGALTSERLTQMYLERIEVYNPALNTIISLNPKAMDEARAADERREAGEAGRLNGIPILVKDNIDVAGMVTTDGSVSLLHNMAYADAEAVRRLKEEGAIILGKTNMAEHAISGTESTSTVKGSVHNAYDPSRTPAGSSGGSAVAVTCNFAALALGTDTGSSVRRPSSFANLYGLRPTFGKVSQTGLNRLNWSKDTIGPMCRSAEDLCLLLSVITGADGAERTDTYAPDPDALSGLRIGYLSSSFGWQCDFFTGASGSGAQPLSDDAARMVERTLAVFTGAGAELVDMSSALSDNTIAAYGQGGMGDANEYFRSLVMEAFAQAQVDVIVYESQLDLAEPLNNAIGRWDNPASYICDLAPVAGLPDLCLPMGLSHGELALGLDLVAPYGDDELLLSIACAYENLTEVRVQPPTTPALPDSSLADFARTLKQEARQKHGGAYSAERLAQLEEALLALEQIRMQTPQIVDGLPVYSDGGVDAVTYHAAVRRLALAYDALESETLEVFAQNADEPETTTPTAQTSEPQPVQTTAAVSAVDDGGWRTNLACVGLVALGAFAVFLSEWLRRKRRR